MKREWTSEYKANRERVLDRDGWTCCYCASNLIKGSSDPKHQPSVDHVLPYSLGGSDSMANLRAACMDCNRRRGNSIEERNNWRNPKIYPLK